MTDPANILSDIEAVLDFAEGPWKPERDRDGDGLRRQRYFIWLTNDAGDSLQIDEGSAVLLANTYPEALAVVRTLERLVKRTPFTPTATGIDVHLTFEQLAEQQATLAAYLAKAQEYVAARDATEAGS